MQQNLNWIQISGVFWRYEANILGSWYKYEVL